MTHNLGLSFYDNDMQGLKFRNDLLAKLNSKFVTSGLGSNHNSSSPSSRDLTSGTGSRDIRDPSRDFSNLGSEIGSGDQAESIDTSLNDSFGIDLDLGSDTYSESPIGNKKIIIRSSSTNQIQETTSRDSASTNQKDKTQRKAGR